MITTVAIIAAALIVVAAIEAPLLACLIGRLKRAQSRSYTDLSLHQPPVPEPVAIDIPADADGAEVERLVYAALFDEIMRPEFPEYREYRESA